ncbi:MAG: hypothetical protein MUO31_14900 [Thermodesulfovibrionales bacterium]|nr:hypothetical protein [Thermodesulfovibrionales bacterium]
MPGKIFISCGQGNNEERQVANQIKIHLISQGYDPFVAVETQSIQDINTSIIGNLKTSDYYIFIDFARDRIGKKKGKSICKDSIFRGSLFTNQELAVAYVLEFKEVLYLQQENVNLEGIGKYLLSNAIQFKSKSDVPSLVEQAIVRKGWNPLYSRHLALGSPNYAGACQYCDHTGTYSDHIWHLPIKNLRYDTAAFDTVVRLNEIVHPNSNVIQSRDRYFLKWVSKINAYSATILPNDECNFDLFALDQLNNSLLRLHSEEDIRPRQPIINVPGNYILRYQIFSKGFPFLKFDIQLNLTGNFNTTKIVII